MTYTPGPAYETQPSDHQPPAGDPARYGQVGPTPWTFAQTVRGAAATLAPWLIFIIGTQLLSSASTTSGQRRLSPAEDIVGAVFAFFVTGVVELAFVIAPAYYTLIRHAPGISPRQGLVALGLRSTRLGPAIVATVVGFVVIIGCNILYSLLIQVFNLPLRTNSDALLQQAKYAPISSLALIAGAVLVAPICEEIFFRGFLFGGLLHRMSFWPAALLSAFLFGLAHGDVGSFAVLFVFGVVLAFVRWRTGSIWPGIVIHAANNATAGLAIILALTGH
ncbi:MAG TPA: CPBP family intramembrane glutamic endopeptidase [Ktedonobacterales bacterium]|jgi:membrane protease YdiL (CAAX protease family)|nr:CPBP family intramembrane glutamic endopeptidase [Ktedonobacterales bacterium]